jgi:hypothetical protein
MIDWLAKILKIDSTDSEYSNPEQWIDVLSKGKDYRDQKVREMQQQPAPEVTPPVTPTRQPNVRGVRDLYKSQLGTSNQESTNLDEYYPLLAESDYIQGLEPTKKRPGLYELLYLMGLQESTGGRATPNAFGVKPGGDRAGQFSNVREAIDYQLSPNVFGGGVGDSLNILDSEGPITEQEIEEMIYHYNPELAYKTWLLENYRKLTE